MTIKLLADERSKRYNESPQVNRVRYTVLQRMAENDYVATTGFFKCKDYFNDFAHFRKYKRNFHVYSMNANCGVFDDAGGMYVLWRGLEFRDQFVHNLALLNPVLEKNWGFSIEEVPCSEYPENGCMVLYYPSKLWESTFVISVTTLLLRNCHWKDKLESYEDLIRKTRVVGESGMYLYYDTLREYLVKGEFTLPNIDVLESLLPVRKWISGTDFADIKKREAYEQACSPDMIHDTGMYGWMMADGEFLEGKECDEEVYDEEEEEEDEHEV